MYSFRHPGWETGRHCASCEWEVPLEPLENPFLGWGGPQCPLGSVPSPIFGSISDFKPSASEGGWGKNRSWDPSSTDSQLVSELSQCFGSSQFPSWSHLCSLTGYGIQENRFLHHQGGQRRECQLVIWASAKVKWSCEVSTFGEMQRHLEGGEGGWFRDGAWGGRVGLRSGADEGVGGGDMESPGGQAVAHTRKGFNTQLTAVICAATIQALPGPTTLCLPVANLTTCIAWYIVAA